QEGIEGRVVKEGYDQNKLFLVGGVFYDDALDYPLPLAGLHYLSFDLKGTGMQSNVFFAGALLQANIADPALGSSRFDAGSDAFVLAVGLNDEVFRGDEKLTGETVKTRPSQIAVHLGHPVGDFFHLGLDYSAFYFNYGSTDDTAKDFVLPSDHLLHSIELNGRYSRSGYRLTASGSWNHRSSWDPWGLPGGSLDAFDPDAQDFTRWDVRLAKSWFLSHFQRLGLEVDYLDGNHLDRFSKYQFGFFGGTRVHGYQSGRVRAEEAILSHLTYGFEVGELLRLDAVADAAWATDKATGLDKELLGGVGLAGTFIGPWQTV